MITFLKLLHFLVRMVERSLLMNLLMIGCAHALNSRSFHGRRAKMKVVIRKKQPDLIDGRYEVVLTTEIEKHETFRVTMHQTTASGCGYADIINKDSSVVVSRYMLFEGDSVEIIN
jgi:hypothetical protein